MSLKDKTKIKETMYSFQQAIQKRLEENIIHIEYNKGEEISANNGSNMNFDFPENVLFILKNLKSITINHPRLFYFYSMCDVKILENNYLHFALLNDNQQICFDTSKINSAGEWDIINYENKYLITMTISSFLTNKVWAWIDRGRQIWREEY
jgi:hypothetical protein